MSDGGYCVRCRKCNMQFFCTSLTEGKKRLVEHWERKHYRGDIAPGRYVEYVYQGAIKKASGVKAIYKRRTVRQVLPTSEYDIERFAPQEWERIAGAIGTPDFNRVIYNS